MTARHAASDYGPRDTATHPYYLRNQWQAVHGVRPLLALLRPTGAHRASEATDV